MNKNNISYNMKQAYKITSSFIIDEDTEMESHSNPWYVEYIFRKQFYNRTTYYLSFFIPRQNIMNNRYGKITLYYYDNNNNKIKLFNAQTTHSVGKILNKSIHLTNSVNICTILEKILSYRFYYLIKMIEKRTTAQITRQDKTTEILQYINNYHTQ